MYYSTKFIFFRDPEVKGDSEKQGSGPSLKSTVFEGAQAARKCQFEMPKEQKLKAQLSQEFNDRLRLMFSGYQKYLNTKVSPRDTDARIKLSDGGIAIDSALKNQFAEWLAEIDFCITDFDTVRNQLHSYMSSLINYVKVWTTY